MNHRPTEQNNPRPAALPEASVIAQPDDVRSLLELLREAVAIIERDLRRDWDSTGPSEGPCACPHCQAKRRWLDKVLEVEAQSEKSPCDPRERLALLRKAISDATGEK